MSPHKKRLSLSLSASLLLAGSLLLPASPALAVNKDMVQLQTQVQALQDAVARLQQSNDERMGVLKDLVQQTADSVNRMSGTLNTLQKQVQAQEGQGAKVDQLSGQIQAINDSLDENKARLGRLEKLLQDIQNQQQSISAQLPAAGTPAGNAAPADNSAPQPVAPAPATPNRKGKPNAGTPMSSLEPTDNAPAAPAAPPAEDLYKTALGDYMGAKYSLASSEFSDVVKFHPDSPLAGNSWYYQGEIQYRAGKYADAVKSYDNVIDQYPDNNKVAVSRLHKGEALIALKQNDAGIRELRGLIQRYPSSPEAMQARSKLSGMGVPVTPRH